ncbi:MAG TPA: zinc ribbon domain-containing protein [Candidatus Pullichristensenella stercorigallinarum]|uniref:Zinc ribbon domain-containing protein n=1 Tax=Candidatus Pullichristensenella stercorigallinarum TaxID=2840909 RepID=A0A9D0ZLE2_9FIRM|nr:zinc ribbon domain-containing protein [Candidatus Pullichristensenella stercorigallinarum]
MKCPYCHKPLGPSDVICPSCGQPLPEHIDSLADRPQSFWDRRLVRVILFVLGALVAIFVIGFAIYKLTFWMEDYQIERLYTRGERTPVVSEITLDDGRSAHLISFFANDGDQIYIPELQRSAIVAGHVARVEIADSDWFEGVDIENVESAEVGLSPVLIEENGARTQLPTIELNIAPPESPIEVISPAEDNLTVFTSVYPLEVEVVPGSTVLVNGEDVTDVVDRNGLLSANVNIYPIGDNVISILVRTPNHLETRRDVIIYRAQLEIEIELDTSVQNETESRQMLISGTCEPGAYIEVDTPYVEESLYVNMQTGDFEFLTNLEYIGENTVRFRAVMEGRADAEIHFNVNYTPTLANYSAAAWPIQENYDQLVRLYAQWQDRVFLCNGEIIEIIEEDGVERLVMDISGNGEDLVVLVNESSFGTPVIGQSYSVYAHVPAREEARYMYNATYYPQLITLYMDVAA